MARKLNIRKVGSQQKLHKIVKQRKSIRVGSTKNPAKRASAYQSEGYRGTMYVASTQNMMKAEDRLMRTAKKAERGRYNVHQLSGAKAKPGYVYVNKGQRRK